MHGKKHVSNLHLSVFVCLRVHSNVATPERSKAPSQMPIEKPPSPPEAINLVVTSNEESKADPTRSTPQRSVNPSRPDVNTTLDDDRPSPTKPPSNIPFAAFPPEQVSPTKKSGTVIISSLPPWSCLRTSCTSGLYICPLKSFWNFVKFTPSRMKAFLSPPILNSTLCKWK